MPKGDMVIITLNQSEGQVYCQRASQRKEVWAKTSIIRKRVQEQSAATGASLNAWGKQNKTVGTMMPK